MFPLMFIYFIITVIVSCGFVLFIPPTFSPCVMSGSAIVAV